MNWERNGYGRPPRGLKIGIVSHRNLAQLCDLRVSIMDQQFVLILDVDMLGTATPEEQESIIADIPGLRIELLEQETGHGFGLAEILTISVSIATSVTSEIAADYIRDGIKAIIRRVKGSESEADGTKEAMTELIEREREVNAPEGTGE